MSRVAADEAGRATGWTLALILLLLALVLLGLVFAAEVVAAVGVWNNSTAYNHCWLVGPIAAWLAWDRRGRLAVLQPRPSWLAALLIVPMSLGWLTAERLGIMEGRQLAALGIMELLALAVLGWRVGRAMAAPLVYLLFLVPTGAFLTPWLQHVTTWFIDAGLTTLGIPHYIDGFVIETPTATFLVAEACAGLRFLIASLAFGTLYALVMFRSPGRRLTVVALSVLVPIIANGFRALGLVLLGHYLGNAEAALADHLTYGWVFFSLVMLLLILAGLPFREDGDVAGKKAAPSGGPAVADGWGGRARLAAVAGLALGFGIAAPALVLRLTEAVSGGPEDIRPALLAPDGCAAAAEVAALRCGAIDVTALLRVFPPRATWSGFAAARRNALPAEDDPFGWHFAPAGGGVAWQLVQARDDARIVAVAGFLSGRPAGGGMTSRVTQAGNSLGLGGGRPVLAVVAFSGEALRGVASSARLRGAIEAVLAAQGPGLVAEAGRRSGPL